MTAIAASASKPGTSPVEGPQVWRGPEMAARPTEWIYEMSAADNADLNAATAAAISTGKNILDIEAVDFSLPQFGAKLAEMREEMLHGRGFKLLRGLPIQDRPIEEVAFMYWGIGAHLGYVVSQNAKGHVLGHVKDLGLDYADLQARGYQTSARLPYHTDYSDLVGLLCLKKARSGGLSSIVSSSALYNHIMAERPDLGEALMQPFYRTRWGEVGSDRPAWIEVPAFN
ncbi:MAG: TauD/TfdA family dioxygenase, partial [Pseudomonadota bacterium]|nr:TauD/TfdA family dioxygenase [Pseudomonadota bacterium]